MIKALGNSTETACKLAGLAKSTWYYQSRESDRNQALSERLKEIATERPRFGSPRLTVLIRSEFGTVNHKRIERLYRDAELTLPRKRRKRKWQGRQKEMLVPDGPDQRWSMDFMTDTTTDGRKFRIFNVVDDFTREAMACIQANIVCQKDKFLDLTNTDGLKFFNHARNKIIEKIKLKNKRLKSGSYWDSDVLSYIKDLIEIELIKAHFYIKFAEERRAQVISRIPNTTVICSCSPDSCIDKSSITVIKKGNVQ